MIDILVLIALILCVVGLVVVNIYQTRTFQQQTKDLIKGILSKTAYEFEAKPDEHQEPIVNDPDIAEISNLDDQAFDKFIKRQPSDLEDDTE